MTEIIIAVIGSGALAAAVSAVVAHVNNKLRLHHGVTLGTQVLLYASIKELGKQYISDGEIGAEDLEDLIEMHRVYHDELGGNGYLDTLMEQVKHLKIKS